MDADAIVVGAGLAGLTATAELVATGRWKGRSSAAACSAAVRPAGPWPARAAA